MGISGLLPFLKKASRPASVSEFSGKTVAIDVYCWLHKGAFGCAEKLIMNQPTDMYIKYVMKYVDMLLHYNIKPILVFDGRNLPSKSETEKKRRETRAKNRKLALDFLREGKNREAREYFQRCIDITPFMAVETIKACRERNIDCIVAPYEADSQLAFLNRNGIADFIISEDSDLAPFGCDKILFKMDMMGNGILYEKEKLPECLGQKADNFTFDKFRYMCIMAGCDYHPSLPGIGLGKSCKFWGKVTNPDLRSVLPKIPSYLNMSALEVNEEYIRGFFQANDTFLYQLVFDPRTRKLRPLSDYPDQIDNASEVYHFCGEYLSVDLALQMALGNVDLNSLNVVGYHDPDEEVTVNESFKPKYGSRANHHSIWWQEDRANQHLAIKNRNEEKKREKETEFQRAFSLPTNVSGRSWGGSKKRAIEYVNSDAEDADDPDAMEQEEQDLVDLYKSKVEKPKFELLAETSKSKFGTNKKCKLDIEVVPDTKIKSKGDDSSKERVVFVSKYFSPSDQVKKSNKDSQNSDIESKSSATQNSKVGSKSFIRQISSIYSKPEPKENAKIEAVADQGETSFNQSKLKKDPKNRSGDWLSELESNVGEDRNDAMSSQATVTSQVIDSKENFRRQLTKLSVLPPLKNNPATRLPFKPVVMSQSEITSEENDVANDDIAKKRNPFAKKMKPVASPQPSLTNPNSFNPRSCGMSDSGFCSQSAAVEISSSQLSVCSIDTDQGKNYSSSLESSQQFVESTSNDDKQRHSINVNRHGLSSPVKSPYFTLKKTSPTSSSCSAKPSMASSSTTPKPRIPVSGLLKRPNGNKHDSKQPNLLQFFSKKT